MKKNLFAWTLALGMMTTWSVTQASAQQFDPATSTNPDGSSVVVSGATGSPNQFAVSGDIQEFIQFKSIDSTLEMGDLGGPKATGERVSKRSAANESAAYVAVTLGAGENGEAGIEFGSNAYVRVLSRHSRLRNNGPDGIRNNADDAVLVTQFARAYRGNRVVRGTTELSGEENGYVQYNTWTGPVGDNTSFQPVVFYPANLNGMKYRGRVTRNGLNDYRGDYTTTINLSYFKY